MTIHDIHGLNPQFPGTSQPSLASLFITQVQSQPVCSGKRLFLNLQTAALAVGGLTSTLVRAADQYREALCRQISAEKAAKRVVNQHNSPPCSALGVDASCDLKQI
jgi:hypothetical protein